MKRISRREFVIKELIITLFLYLVYNSKELFFKNEVLLILFIIVMSIMSIISMILIIKRLHDIDKSGWLFLLLFIPGLNLGVITLFFIDGTHGNNSFGEDPLGRINEEKYIEKKGKKISNARNAIDKFDESIELLNESLSANLINKDEFESKRNQLIKNRNISQNQNDLLDKKHKLKSLYNNNLISEDELRVKLAILSSSEEDDISDYSNLSLNSEVYYLEKSKIVGPIQLKKLISLVNSKKINPNCFIKTEIDLNYTYRAHEIVRFFNS